MNRILYFLSLMEKYTRPFLYADDSDLILAKLLSHDRVVLSEEKVRELFPEKMPMDPSILAKCVKYLNSFSKPLEMAIRVIRRHIPTRYRFLCPRYLKQVTKHKMSAELN